MNKVKKVKTISICLPADMVEKLRFRAWCAGVSLSSYIAVCLSEAERLRDPEDYADTDSVKVVE